MSSDEGFKPVCVVEVLCCNCMFHRPPLMLLSSYHSHLPFLAQFCRVTDLNSWDPGGGGGGGGGGSCKNRIGNQVKRGVTPQG